MLWIACGIGVVIYILLIMVVMGSCKVAKKYDEQTEKWMEDKGI